MKYFLFVVLVFMGLIPDMAAAQDDSIETWDIVKRCLLNPIAPDESWSFDGEILMYGWAGIHGVNANLDTPYVVSWHRGVISPDGQWILTQKVHSYTEQLTGGGPLGRYYFFYGDIYVQNLETGEQLVFPWQGQYIMNSSPYLGLPVDPLWLDNHRFIAFYDRPDMTRVADINTGEVVEWENIDLRDTELSISPDLTRMVYYSNLYSLPDNQLIGADSIGEAYDFGIPLWSNNSALIADTIFDSYSGTGGGNQTLVLYDRDGNKLATPFAVENMGVGLLQWSPNDQYLAFTVTDYNDYSNTYLLDMQQQVVIDLCADAQGWAWSPNGSQFATIIGSGQAPVVVVEMQQWQPYIVAYHTGRVFMWRTP